MWAKGWAGGNGVAGVYGVGTGACANIDTGAATRAGVVADMSAGLGAGAGARAGEDMSVGAAKYD